MKRLLTFVFLWAFACNLGAQIILTNVAHYLTSGNASAVAISGHYAYVANLTDGLRVYDVSNPAFPINIGHTNNGTGAFDLVISGNYLYLADHYFGLGVYDISSPANPVCTRLTNFSAFCMGIGLSSRYVYLGSDAALGIFDAVTPSTPLLVGQLNQSKGPRNLLVATNKASQPFLATAGDGLYFYSVSNLTSPVLLAHTNVVGDPGHLAFANDHLYFANGFDGLRIYDAANIAAPVNVGHFVNTNNDSTYSVVVTNNIAFLGCSQGLRLLDVSNPALPVNIAFAPNIPGAHSYGVAVSGNYIYVANSLDGLRIFTFRPQLTTTHAGSGDVLFSWPAIGPFVLQRKNVSGGAGWATVTNTPVLVGCQNQITLSGSLSNAYYRLRSP